MVSAMLVLPGPAAQPVSGACRGLVQPELPSLWLCTQANVTHSWSLWVGSPSEEITVQRGIKGSFLLGNI